jgi:hypothetical protein
VLTLVGGIESGLTGVGVFGFLGVGNLILGVFYLIDLISGVLSF